MNIKVVRNWLNTIFIIGAIIGMLVYYKGNQTTGIYIILCAMIIKFIESALRMTNRNE